MEAVYKEMIEDSILDFEKIRDSAVKSCKWRVPVPFVEDQKYLVCYQDGRFLGFAETLKEAGTVAHKWIWEFGEGHMEKGSVVSWGKDHMYYVINLDPASHWSKKYLAGKEELTPFDAYAYFSASHFYEKEYLESVQKASWESACNAMMNDAKRKDEENSVFWRNFVGGAILVLWAFGAFSCLGP